MESSTKLARAMVTMYGMSDKVMLDPSIPFLLGEEFSLLALKTIFLPCGEILPPRACRIENCFPSLS